MLLRYARDRFVRPGRPPWRPARRADDLLLGCPPADEEMVTLTPLSDAGEPISGYGLDQLAALIDEEAARG